MESARYGYRALMLGAWNPPNLLEVSEFVMLSEAMPADGDSSAVLPALDLIKPLAYGKGRHRAALAKPMAPVLETPKTPKRKKHVPMSCQTKW